MSTCSFFGSTKYKDLTPRADSVLSYLFSQLIDTENVDTFYTEGKTGFDTFCLSVLQELKEENNIKLIKIVRKGEQFSLDENSPFDDIIEFTSDRCQDSCSHITQISDFVVFDTVEKGTYTNDIFTDLVYDGKMYKKYTKVIILDKKAQDKN